MIPLTSAIEGHELDFANLRDRLSGSGFTLGGNWDYTHGSLDRPLDERHTVFLRIPFDVIRGELDGDDDNPEAVVRIGTPYVLKHLYEDNTDQDTQPRIYGALVDQFAAPIDKDADVEQNWVEQAAAVLKEAEQQIRP
ncbi:YugN family protein [Paenibacillus sp. y28]|uniref:YugN family protein n=1 Tax=Paenibacillus sp. y28 TaxID=3129110 RepID=UPI00301B36B8